MSLLMPELERQLRAAARELARASSTEQPRARRRRRRRFDLGAVVLAASVLAALAIGAVALVTLGHRTASPAAPGAAAGGLISPVCPRATVVGSALKPRYFTVARGAVAGEVWSFREPYGVSGPAAGYLGRLHFGGHVYGLCPSQAQLQLIDRAGDGVVYGFIGARGVRSVQVGAGRGHLLAVHRVSVIGGVFFIRSLPHPACTYRDIGLAWTLADGKAVSGLLAAAPGSRASILVFATQHFHGCKARAALVPTTLIGSSVAGGAPNPIPVNPPRRLSKPARGRFLAGERVAAQAGCLACHRIGTDGNNGPGPNLTDIGSLGLSAATLRDALINPKAPMPSFRGLSRARLDALIAFLQDLRGPR